MPSISSVFFFVGVLVLQVSAQQIPTQFTFPLTSQSENGSSATGHCTGATRLSDRYQCDDPTSSVVYDDRIPTLTGLDGNMWASQLLTINARSAVLVFNFTGTPNFQVRRVEMVVFNCPQWGISVQSVVLTNSALTQLGSVNPTLSSCDSLVRVCIPNLHITSSQELRLLFNTTNETTDYMHIAEVGLYGNSGTCPPEIFILEPTTSTTEIAVIPTWLTFPLTSRSVNGSSATGNCTNATEVLSDRYQCFDPTSSVVYDDHIPTLTGLDGNMWASQLLTINASSAVLVFNFTGTPNFQVRRVEMVVFNCPQWGISVQSVNLTNSDPAQLGAVNPTLFSCDSLLKLCIPNVNITSSQQELSVLFTTHESTGWIHIAEVGFYGNSSTCPPEDFIPEPTTATTSTTDTTAINTTSQEVVTPTNNGATLSTGVGAGVAAGIFFLMVTAVVIIIVVAVICLKSKKGKVWRFNAHNVLNKTDNIYNMDDKVNMEDIEGPEDEKRDMYDVPSHNRSGCLQSPVNQEEAYNQLGGIGRNKPLAHGDELHEAYSQLGHSGVSGAGEIRSVSKVDNHPSQSAPAQEYAALNKDTNNHGPPSQPTQPPAQEYAVVNKDTNGRKPPLQPTQPPGQEYSVLY